MDEYDPNDHYQVIEIEKHEDGYYFCKECGEDVRYEVDEDTEYGDIVYWCPQCRTVLYVIETDF
jgi:transcription initiation factor IIE alpha subunit